jgi:tetratricopeptide (TPR) repeat protein
MPRRFTLAAPLLALSVATSAALAQSSSNPPECEHLNYRGNFRLNGAEQHMDLAASGRVDKDNEIRHALRLLDQARQAGGVDEATLWYLYGKAYVMLGDLAGADSAYTKAQALTDPECREAIDRRRYAQWVPLFNVGIEQMNGGNFDSALTMFRKASVIYRSGPHAFMNMAQIFHTKATSPDSAEIARGDTATLRKAFEDSAIVYFRRAAHSSDDPRTLDTRETALFDAARLLQRQAVDSADVHAEAQRRGVADSVVREQRLKATEGAYRDVLKLRPRDLAAQASLAGVMTALHHEDQARMVYDSMLAHSDSMESLDLFDAGVALFRSARYQLAARFIETGLAKNRCYRDGLYNLANAYLAAKDSTKLLDAAHRLVAVDSMNRSSLQLLARAFQDNDEKDSVVWILLRADSLPWEIQGITFDTGDSTATLHAMVTNLRSSGLKGFPLTVDFVDGSCQPVASQVVDLPDLNAAGSPGQAYDFTLTVNGRGILAWKYKTN